MVDSQQNSRQIECDAEAFATLLPEWWCHSNQLKWKARFHTGKCPSGKGKYSQPSETQWQSRAACLIKRIAKHSCQIDPVDDACLNSHTVALIHDRSLIVVR